MMVSSEQKERVIHLFDSYCKTVMRFEARTCYKVIQRRNARAMSLDSLIEIGYFESSGTVGGSLTSIEYVDFHIKGHSISLANESLAVALSKLSDEKREIIFLYYFFGFNDREIARKYRCTRNMIRYRRRRALQLLRVEME
jgi:RNA polymerase sigma factor (sigma-70 family)